MNRYCLVVPLLFFAVSPCLAEDAKSLKIRVILTGFDVKHETRDHAGNADGKHDEVFTLVLLRYLQKEGGPDRLPAVVRQSKVMGDIDGNPGRVQAGTDSPKGGLVSGNRFPTNEPWKVAVELKADELPMLLYEGEVVDGGAAVVVTPSIWEWDGPGGIENQAKTFLEQPSRFPFDLGGALGVFGVSANRPIGLQRLKPAPEHLWYTPQPLNLSYKTVAEIINTEFVPGHGKGSIEFNFGDADELGNGYYKLYLLVEPVK
jgi:hypothetical protein